MKTYQEIEYEVNVWGFPKEPIETFIGQINAMTIVHTWIVMFLVAVLLIAATRSMSLERPGKLQLIIEEIFQFLRGVTRDSLDAKKASLMMCFVFSLFMFILISNLWGLIPTMYSPTADLNTTMGLALMVYGLTVVLGIYYKGLKYFKHFIQPFPFFLPLVIVEELAKPLTMAFRLYGNVYAGKVLVYVLLGLIPLTATLMGGFIASVIWLAFKIFISCVQAYIFFVLTVTYTSQAVMEAEHH